MSVLLAVTLLSTLGAAPVDSAIGALEGLTPKEACQVLGAILGARESDGSPGYFLERVPAPGRVLVQIRTASDVDDLRASWSPDQVSKACGDVGIELVRASHFSASKARRGFVLVLKTSGPSELRFSAGHMVFGGPGGVGNILDGPGVRGRVRKSAGRWALMKIEQELPPSSTDATTVDAGESGRRGQ